MKSVTLIYQNVKKRNGSVTPTVVMRVHRKWSKPEVG